MEENKKVDPKSTPQARKSTAKPTQAKKAKATENKKSPIGVVLMILAIVVLGGVSGFLLFRDQENTKVIMAKQESIDTLTVFAAAQSADLENEKQKLINLQNLADEMQIKVDSLPILIQEIEDLQKDLKKAKGSTWFFKQRSETYATKIASIENEIRNLIEEKDMALAKIDTLNMEKMVMSDTLRAIKQEKSFLAEKVAIASVLQGHDYKVSGYSSKGKEFSGPQFKSKQLAKVKLVFNLAENKVTPQDVKKIVMRLIEPDGTVLFSGSEGGSFETSTGEDKMFSMSQNVSFSGNKQKVSFVYQKGNEYKSGKHTIEVYADGHLLGNTNFVVK